jgi:hypothetical protein
MATQTEERLAARAAAVKNGSEAPDEPAGFEVEKLREVGKSLPVSYKGQVAQIEYSEDALSGAAWEALREPLPEGERQYSFYIRLLVQVLVKWDVKVKGEPVPLTAEAIFGLPPRFIEAVAIKILEDLVPKPTTESDTSSFAPEAAAGIPSPAG